MHPQSLSTLAEERREDTDGDGVVKLVPFFSFIHYSFVHYLFRQVNTHNKNTTELSRDSIY